jgi:phosphoribosylformylglycinamidine synthase
MMNAKVIVMPKAAVLDPQGNAVRDAMRHLGMPEVRSVRIGKYMEIDIEGQDGELESRLHQLCRDLLSNPVIEDYELLREESALVVRVAQDHLFVVVQLTQRLRISKKTALSVCHRQAQKCSFRTAVCEWRIIYLNARSDHVTNKAE